MSSVVYRGRVDVRRGYSVRVFDERTGELVYALRAAASTLRAPVYGPGPFRLVVGDSGGPLHERTGLLPAGADAAPIVVDL